MYVGKTILYIEDEEMLVDLVVEELRDAGFKCIHASEFSDAQKKANNQKFDLIITDLQILKGSADELIVQIRENEKHVNNQTPIIVTSAHITDEIHKRIDNHINSVLKKPHTIDHIFEEIDKILK
jgi:DNA-binding response OmpR family regulator